MSVSVWAEGEGGRLSLSGESAPGMALRFVGVPAGWEGAVGGEVVSVESDADEERLVSVGEAVVSGSGVSSSCILADSVDDCSGDGSDVDGGDDEEEDEDDADDVDDVETVGGGGGEATGMSPGVGIDDTEGVVGVDISEVTDWRTDWTRTRSLLMLLMERCNAALSF